MRRKVLRRTLGGGAIVAGALLMWLSPEQVLAGALMMLGGMALEAIGIALEHG